MLQKELQTLYFQRILLGGALRVFTLTMKSWHCTKTPVLPSFISVAYTFITRVGGSFTIAANSRKTTEKIYIPVKRERN